MNQDNIRFLELPVDPVQPNLWGAERGTRHLAPFFDDLESAPAARDLDGPGIVVVLDFSHAESVTASYVKATVFRMLDVFRGDERPDDRRRPPLNIYPAITGPNSEVSAELDEVFIRHGRTCLEVVELDFFGLLKARIRGALDHTLAQTLLRLTTLEAASAQDMHARFPEPRPVTATAWNNRLSDLHAKRLVRRVRDGRQWRYQAIAREIEV